jgi:hypothetical protein
LCVKRPAISKRKDGRGGGRLLWVGSAGVAVSSVVGVGLLHGLGAAFSGGGASTGDIARVSSALLADIKLLPPLSKSAGTAASAAIDVAVAVIGCTASLLGTGPTDVTGDGSSDTGAEWRTAEEEGIDEAIVDATKDEGGSEGVGVATDELTGEGTGEATGEDTSEATGEGERPRGDLPVDGTAITFGGDAA